MKRLTQLTLAALGAASIATTFASRASADEPTVAPAPLAPPPLAQPSLAGEHSQEKPSDDSFKHFSLELNPLSTIVGRYSAQVEWLPAAHHAIVLNPHFDHVSSDITVGKLNVSETFTGFGAELGYRFYSGTHGANGFYAGPSVIVATYSTGIGDGPSQSFSTIGGAFDVGGQVIVGPGVVIGAGAGLQYTKSSLDLNNTDGFPLAAAILASSGVRPRVLLSVGYAF